MTRTCDEFTCRTCGRLVYSMPPLDPPPEQCAMCAWLDEFVADTGEREALRRRLCEVAP